MSKTVSEESRAKLSWSSCALQVEESDEEDEEGEEEGEGEGEGEEDRLGLPYHLVSIKLQIFSDSASSPLQRNEDGEGAAMEFSISDFSLKREEIGLDGKTLLKRGISSWFS